MPIQWYEALEEVRKLAFKTQTPQGFGTGFLLAFDEKSALCAIATAYHVVEHAHAWEEPIKLTQATSGDTVMLTTADRAIVPYPGKDLAIIVLSATRVQVPSAVPSLTPQGWYAKPGVEISWGGYPTMAPDKFSFFSGHVSCFLAGSDRYLVDGVVINGVSGGPVFVRMGARVNVIGVVSGYMPNVAMGAALPGVCFMATVEGLHALVKQFASLDDAKEKAEAATPAAPPPQRRRQADFGWR